MINSTPISKIMTKDVFMVNINDTIGEVGESFRNHSLRHAPVVFNGRLMGMLSLVDVKNQSDIDESDANFESRYLPLSVKHLMTPDPVSVQMATSIKEVAALFTEHEFHAIPVLDGEKIVGIVSTTDVIQFFLDNWD